jgi:hypothetical protein
MRDTVLSAIHEVPVEDVVRCLKLEDILNVIKPADRLKGIKPAGLKPKDLEILERQINTLKKKMNYEI